MICSEETCFDWVDELWPVLAVFPSLYGVSSSYFLGPLMSSGNNFSFFSFFLNPFLLLDWTSSFAVLNCFLLWYAFVFNIFADCGNSSQSSKNLAFGKHKHSTSSSHDLSSFIKMIDYLKALEDLRLKKIRCSPKYVPELRSTYLWMASWDEIVTFPLTRK